MPNPEDARWAETLAAWMTAKPMGTAVSAILTKHAGTQVRPGGANPQLGGCWVSGGEGAAVFRNQHMVFVTLDGPLRFQDRCVQNWQ
ncbi:hypothetical protein C2E31_11330, partial [Rhodopirellula baltica]